MTEKFSKIAQEMYQKAAAEQAAKQQKAEGGKAEKKAETKDEPKAEAKAEWTSLVKSVRKWWKDFGRSDDERTGTSEPLSQDGQPPAFGTIATTRQAR